MLNEGKMKEERREGAARLRKIEVGQLERLLGLSEEMVDEILAGLEGSEMAAVLDGSPLQMKHNTQSPLQVARSSYACYWAGSWLQKANSQLRPRAGVMRLGGWMDGRVVGSNAERGSVVAMLEC